MLRQILQLRDLEYMTPDESARALSEVVQAAGHEPNGGLQAVELELRGYEQRHGLSSDEMVKQIDAGDLEEDDDIACWLMAYHLKRRLLGEARP